MVAITANSHHTHGPLIVVATATATTTTTTMTTSMTADHRHDNEATTIDEATKDNNALAHEIPTTPMLSLPVVPESTSSSFDSSGSTVCTTSSADSSCPDTQIQTRRSVSFQSTKRVYCVPSRRQLSKEERQNYYYSQEEQRKMKDEIRQWTKTMQKKKKKNLKKQCHLDDDDVDDDINNEDASGGRGLERCTQSVFLQTKAWKHRARNVVMDHQSMGTSEAYVAALYKQCSEESCASARARALIDQQVMIDITGRLKDSSSPPLNLVMLR